MKNKNDLFNITKDLAYKRNLLGDSKMLRYYFRHDGAEQAAEILFGGNKDFDPESFAKYYELELVLQADGRYSVWGNFDEDSELIQDTRKDPQGLVRQASFLAEEVWDDEEEPEDPADWPDELE